MKTSLDFVSHAREVSTRQTAMRSYFSYGSNLDIRQMRARCPSVVREGRAYLAGHRLAFGGHSAGWGGAVATVVRAHGARVPGVLYRITEEDFAVLDDYEGTYERRRVRVVDDDGRRRNAETYVLPIACEATPSLAYLTVIAHAYRALGYDGAALAELARKTA